MPSAALTFFWLVVYEEVLAGTVRDGATAVYQIRYFGEGTHVVRQIDPTAFPRCAVTSESIAHLYDRLGYHPQDEFAHVGFGANSSYSRSADDGSVHDILVLYSNVTREAAGGTSAIRAEIQLAIDMGDDAYADSDIASRLRLVHMAEVPYDEVTGWDGFLDHVTRLWDPADGYSDESHEWRDRLGADLVSLIVEDSSSDVIGGMTCGIAPVMQEMSHEFEEYAVSVVNRECSADNWTLAPEVGHNQGCAHNREDASIEGLFTYSYGHRFTGDTRGWRTIMAYDSSGAWERFGGFSNPSISHDGAVTGVPIGNTGEAHNASTINSTRVTVAGFRTTRYWVDLDWTGIENGLFDSPFGTLADGLGAVPEGGMVVVKSGYVTDGMIFTKHSQINSWNGSTVIGAAGP